MFYLVVLQARTMSALLLICSEAGVLMETRLEFSVAGLYYSDGVTYSADASSCCRLHSARTDRYLYRLSNTGLAGKKSMLPW